MKRLCQRGVWLAVGAVAVFYHASASAEWGLSSAADPSRNWSANLSLQGVYDDNLDTSSGGNKGGFGTFVEPQLFVRFPSERTSLGLRYTYRFTQYEKTAQIQNEQSHVSDITLFHSFNPRLALAIQDSVRRGLEPSLVQDVGGVPVVVRERGDYIFNQLSSTLSYVLTRRWNVSVGGSWQLWRYDVASYASYLDRDDYAGTASTVFSLTPRTSVGGTYVYTQTEYVNSGTNNTVNSTAHTFYLSVFHKFNPMLSTQLSGGLSLLRFDDGQQSVAPYVNLSGTYNFSPLSSLSAGFNYTANRADLVGYRTVDSAAFYARAGYMFTTKLSATVEGAYILSQYGNPSGFASSNSQQEDGWRLQLSIAYAFRQWMSLVATCTHDESDSDLANRPFSRNRIYTGLNLSY